MQDLAQRVQLSWRRLKAKFRWTLVEDDAAFVDDMVRMLQPRLERKAISDTEIDVAIQQVYNRHLYETFIAGLAHLSDNEAVDAMNRACHEMYLNALRQVRSKVADGYTAEEIAQKVVMRLIERPHALREPGALPAWIKWQILDLLKVIRTRRPEESLDADDGPGVTIAAEDSAMQQVDSALLADQILDDLPLILSSFQQRVIQLVILEARSAKEAAAILGVRDSQVRAEQARALNKIRQHMKDRW